MIFQIRFTLIYSINNPIDEYQYKFDPCGDGIECEGGSSTTDNAVSCNINASSHCPPSLKQLCQNQFSIGKVGQATYSRNSTDPYIFTVLFAGGDDNR